MARPIDGALVDRIQRRFWTRVSGALDRYGPTAAQRIRLGYPMGPKLSEYTVRWAYYENKGLYQVLYNLGLIPSTMPTEWNPVPAVILFYQDNTLGRDLRIVAQEERRQEALEVAINLIWTWSNFPRLTEGLVETAAVLTDSYIKVAERTQTLPSGEPGETSAVYLQEIPPETVDSVEVDERGFVTAIRIDTPRTQSLFTGEARSHVHVEYWKKKWDDGSGGVRFYEIPPGITVENSRLGSPIQEKTFEELGYDFIPVVYSQTTAHWWLLTDQIDRYNALGWSLSRLNRPVMVIHGRHVDAEGRPMPAPRVTTEEQRPTAEEVADGTAMMIRVPGLAQVEYAQGPIDFATALRQQEAIRRGVEDALSEYRIATLDATQVTTETLQILFGMAGERVLSMRESLETALARAQQMALSMAQRARLPGFSPELIGTWEDQGIIHRFEERDVFTPTAGMVAAVFQQLMTGDKLPVKLAMEAAGFSQWLIDKYDEEAEQAAVRERTTLAAQLVKQQAAFDAGLADNSLTQP